MTLAGYILACAFWLLAALALVLLAAFVYCEVQYYHWNKQDRDNQDLVKILIEQIEEKFEELQNDENNS